VSRNDAHSTVSGSDEAPMTDRATGAVMGSVQSRANLRFGDRGQSAGGRTEPTMDAFSLQ
jgi:hypothetical protein